ncbi:DoxX family protein [Candidatus Chrysopegis kryptomonas]|jgi:putative oxidoreductase|uniref:Putative oxidoreductase n=1 Tax=Candidatus Chryseopegocella kryptomonas TaxID=1633643 RepID=A0A0P1MQG4_9BACT|nr:DoxX family protein [Candidatus Chrysopegis kryptomonas]CUS97777.1 putative oxidoreductase [Candidatus Chrysopegis kryptomonas]
MEAIWVIGRILFSVLFIMSGFGHFRNYKDMVQYAQMMKAPAPNVTVLLTGVMIILGGLSVLFNFYTTIGAVLLFLFLVPTAFIMHKFWGVQDPGLAANQMAHFMKNLSLAGASLIIIYLDYVLKVSH